MNAKAVAAHRVQETRAGIERGWRYISLKGKVPTGAMKGWSQDGGKTIKPPSQDLVLQWALGNNVGLICGPTSGVFVVDVDTYKGGTAEVAFPDGVPFTPVALTGRDKDGVRGMHFYFRAPDPCPTIGSDKIAEGVDTRGQGGYVVAVGSVHPETGRVYEWAPNMSPDEVLLAEVPASVLAALSASQRPSGPKSPAPPSGSGSPPAAVLPKAKASPVRRARAYLAKMPPAIAGQSGHQKAWAAALRVVRGFALDDEQAFAVLSEWNGRSQPPWSEKELRHKIRDAAAAAHVPFGYLLDRRRDADERSGDEPRKPHKTLSDGQSEASARVDVLKPGSHLTSDGEVIEQGTDTWLEEIVGVLAAVAPDAVVRNLESPKVIVGVPGKRKLTLLTSQPARVVIDRYVRSVKWVQKGKGDNAFQEKVMSPPTKDLGELFCSVAGKHTGLRECDRIVNCPVYLPGFEGLAQPGLNVDGTYFDADESVRGLRSDLPAEECIARLMDAYVDFPFETDCDRQNFFGALLTPVLHPAFCGRAPWIHVDATTRASGKSMLVTQGVGIVLTGEEFVTASFPKDDEARKECFAMLRGGATTLCLDNLPERVASDDWSKALTSATVTQRGFHTQEMLEAKNVATTFSTGNNTTFHDDLARRICAVRLAPDTANPESRTEFVHRDFRRHIVSQRRPLLEALLGLVEHWRRQGRPVAGFRLASFEPWSDAVGGVLAAAGMTQWMTRFEEWKRKSAPDRDAWVDFFQVWWKRWGAFPVLLSPDLIDLVRDRGFLPGIVNGDSKKAVESSLGRRLRGQIGRWVALAGVDVRLAQCRLDDRSAFKLEERKA